MTRSDIEHIIKNIFRQVKKSIRQIRKDFDEDAIHKFRIEIKKLRAFLRLLSIEMKEPDDLKLSKSLKEIYSSAGKIRSLQLQLSRINNLQKNKTLPEDYIKTLEKDLDKRKDELKTLLQESTLSHIEKRIISNLPENIEEPVLTKFYEIKMKNIKEIILTAQFSDTDLHSIRKLLKDMLYVSKIIQNHRLHLAQAIPLAKVHLESIENISDHLGAFTDIYSAMPYFKPAYLNEIEPEEKKELDAIRTNWNQEKDALKTELIRIIVGAPAFQTFE